LSGNHCQAVYRSNGNQHRFNIYKRSVAMTSGVDSQREPKPKPRRRSKPSPKRARGRPKKVRIRCSIYNEFVSEQLSHSGDRGKEAMAEVGRKWGLVTAIDKARLRLAANRRRERIKAGIHDPSPWGLACERERQRAETERQQLVTTIKRSIVDTGRLPSPSLNDLQRISRETLCSLGSSLGTLKEALRAYNSHGSRIRVQGALVQRDALRRYAKTHAGAATDFAETMGCDAKDFVVLPPLDPSSVNLSWHPVDAMSKAKKVASADAAKSKHLAETQACVSNMWKTMHLPVVHDQCPAVPKHVPRLLSRCYDLGCHVCDAEEGGVELDMVRCRFEAVFRQNFPAGSAVRRDLKGRWVCVAITTENVLLDGLAAASGEDGEGDAPAVLKPPIWAHIIDVNLNTFSAHFLDIVSESSVAAETISFTATDLTLDRFQLMINAIANMADIDKRLCCTFFKLIASGPMMAELIPALQCATRLFPDAADGGKFCFWNGRASEAELTDFSMKLCRLARTPFIQWAWGPRPQAASITHLYCFEPT
jgi:hypothetical protein